MSGEHSSLKAILYALGANLGIALAKTVSAIITGSGSMLAEAIHSFADSANQVLLLFGLNRAKKPATPQHPLGYGKAIYFWSFIVALMLFSIGGLASIYEGTHKLSHREPIAHPWVAIGVLAFSIILESFSLMGALQAINKVRNKQTLWKWFKNSRESELMVVFGEDIAALFGLVLALIAILLTMITGNPLFDALGSISIGVLLLLVAVGIGVEVKNLLIGESADPEIEKQIISLLSQQKEISEVLNLITLQLGPDIMVSAKIKMENVTSLQDVVESINRAEKVLKTEFPQIKWSFFEPDDQQ